MDFFKMNKHLEIDGFLRRSPPAFRLSAAAVMLLQRKAIQSHIHRGG